MNTCFVNYFINYFSKKLSKIDIGLEFKLCGHAEPSTTVHEYDIELIFFC